MEFDLLEPIKVASKVGDRLILVRSSGVVDEFATVDFEWRRWQLGNHPHRLLCSLGKEFKGRNWRKDLVREAANALLAMPGSGQVREGQEAEAAATVAQDPEVPGDKAAVNPSADAVLGNGSSPINEYGTQKPFMVEGETAYAWKRLEDGTISQAIIAPTPEQLFVQAGFRPHRVLDPIQGFRCVSVNQKKGFWVENLGL